MQPGWPAASEQLSILLQREACLPGGFWLCKLDFLVREPAMPFTRPGAVFLIMEGPKVVAGAVITDVLPKKA